MTKPGEPIICPLYQASIQDPGRPAVVWGGRRITYSQLDQYVDSAVRGLKERGIRPGHRVALLGENSVEYVIALLGMWRLGAVACPVSPKFPPQTIQTLLRTLKVRSVALGASFNFRGTKPSCQVMAMSDLIVYDAKDVLSRSQSSQLMMPEDQEAAIVLTSGSTAEPKAAVLTYGNLYFNALGSNTCIALDERSAWLLSLPLYHVSGLGIVMRCLIARCAMVVAGRENALRLISDGKVTHVSMVATQLERWLKDPQFKRPENLKALLLGGSALPKNLLHSAMDRGLPVYVSYGLTEMASQVATGKLLDAARSPARVLPHRELKTATDGEICVKGRTLFKGYLQGDSARLPLDNEGWFHTNDVGRIEDGCLTVLGRKDNMFISGGENIHPEEIEAALLRIPAVVQAVVVAQDDDEFGHRPVAFVRWADASAALTEVELKKTLAQQLPKFKVPDAFYPWPDKNGENWKVDRKYFIKLIQEQ